MTLGEFSDAVAAMTSVENLPKQQRLQEELELLFDRLDDDEKKLITLRVEGYSTAEAARELGKDPDVTRVQLSRLRKRIKNMGIFSDWL